jgi:hypothetical protein
MKADDILGIESSEPIPGLEFLAGNIVSRRLPNGAIMDMIRNEPVSMYSIAAANAGKPVPIHKAWLNCGIAFPLPVPRHCRTPSYRLISPISESELPELSWLERQLHHGNRRLGRRVEKAMEKDGFLPYNEYKTVELPSMNGFDFTAEHLIGREYECKGFWREDARAEELWEVHGVRNYHDVGLYGDLTLVVAFGDPSYPGNLPEPARVIEASVGYLKVKGYEYDHERAEFKVGVRRIRSGDYQWYLDAELAIRDEGEMWDTIFRQKVQRAAEQFNILHGFQENEAAEKSDDVRLRTIRNLDENLLNGRIDFESTFHETLFAVRHDGKYHNLREFGTVQRKASVGEPVLSR